jgi:hypothetical protein
MPGAVRENRWFGRGGREEGNGERSGSEGRSDWPVRLAGMVGGGAGMALAMLVGALADLPRGGWRGFWLGMIMVGVGVSVGVVLGRLAGSLVFRRPPGSGPGA